MVVGKRLALLGFVTSILWRVDEDSDLFQTTWKGSNSRSDEEKAVLCCNAKGTAIYILPWGTVEHLDVERFPSRVSEMFEEWSGLEANDAFKIEIEEDTLFLVGNIEEINYESDKYDGELRRYVHTFETNPKLYADTQDDPAVWGILHERGDRLVDETGIIS